MKEELQSIKCYIIGLAYIRRKDEKAVKLNSGNMLHHLNCETNGTRGIGFIIPKRILGKVTVYKSLSERVA